MRTKALSFLAAVAVTLTPLFASAQTSPTTGFAISPYNPSARGSDWFDADSLDLRGNVRPAIGIVGDYAIRPLTFKRNGEDIGAPVRTQGFAHLGASLVLFDRLRLHLNVPVMFAESGESTTFTSGEVLPGAKSSALSDVRLGADVKLFGTYGEGVTGALGVQVFAPVAGTKGSDAYASDDAAKVVPRFSIANDGTIAWSAYVGASFEKSGEQFDARQAGTSIIFGGAIGARILDRKLLVGPEVYGSSQTSDFFGRASTPLEAILGAHYSVTDSVRIGAAAGTGITTAFGDPRARFLAMVEFFPAIEKAKPGDRDGDGILDETDACPDVKGVASDDAKKNGCPVGDTDGDGVLDPDDACVTVKGEKSDDPKKNGCPGEVKDTDGDGILDPNDACVDVKGVADDDPKKNGCPPAPKDQDNDGILDPDDACPTQPGPKSDDPKKNGCPAVRVENGQIKILEQVKFKTGSSVILKESDGILSLVANVLKEHKDIAKVRVEGHTDNRGNAAGNKALSQARAAAVVTWLTKHGIEAKRLSPQGFGQEKPIDTNDTDAGRQNNRRVEFHIE